MSPIGGALAYLEQRQSISDPIINEIHDLNPEYSGAEALNSGSRLP